MNKSTLIVAGITLLLGIGLGYWLSLGPEEKAGEEPERKPLYYRNPMDPTITSQTPAQDSMGMDYIPVYEESKEEEREVLFYRNPMNPDITSPTPAKDWMGMDYIPVYADASVEASGTVNIDPVVVQNIGVRTKPVVRKDISRTIRAVGRVDVNEEKITRLHPKVEGWVEEIFIETTGELVEVDDMLMGFYSPKLVASQQEYVLALAGRGSLGSSSIEEVKRGADQLLQSSLERLRFFDVPEHQLRELEETRKVKRSLHIHSPVAGTIINVGVRQGQYITPQTEIYQITDLSEVWVYIDVYDYDLPWVRMGDKVELTLASLPGEVFTGVLSYIFPYAEANTRTTKLRVGFDNPEYRLRPEMFADALIHADPLEDVLVIPSEAVVRSGEGTQVFVMRGEGKFEPRDVSLGIASGNETVVLRGVSEGEQVVASAQFLIDSESKLKEATAKMLEVMRGESAPSKEAEMPMEHHHHD